MSLYNKPIDIIQYQLPLFHLLGKLCLQHDDIAKKCIPALGRELETSQDAPVRNNVVIALCDLFKV